MFVVWRGDLLLSLLMKEFLKSVNIWRSYVQEGCFTRCVHLGLSCIEIKNLPSILRTVWRNCCYLLLRY